MNPATIDTQCMIGIDDEDDLYKILDSYNGSSCESGESIKLSSNFSEFGVTITLNPKLYNLSAVMQLKLSKKAFEALNFPKMELFSEFTKQGNIHWHGYISSAIINMSREERKICLIEEFKAYKCTIAGKKEHLFGFLKVEDKIKYKDKWDTYIKKDINKTVCLLSYMSKKEKTENDIKYYKNTLEINI